MRASRPLSRLEYNVVEMLLAGDDPRVAVLRQQLHLSSVARRQLTGVGFHTYFAVPSGAPRAELGSRSVDLAGVFAEIDGLAHGAGFVLFITDGLLDNLEGFSYDELWPESAGNFSLSYSHGKPPSLS